MTSMSDEEMGEPGDDQPVRVAIGTHVDVVLVTAAGAEENLAFDVVSDDRADFAAGYLGAGTPLAQAILGQRSGSQLEYKAADVVQVRILNVSASARTPAADVAAERQAVIRKAISRSNLAEAQRLALTVDVKWGDYDPEGIEANWADD